MTVILPSAASSKPDPSPGTPQHALALGRIASQARKMGVALPVSDFAARPLDHARKHVLSRAAAAAPAPSPAPSPAERDGTRQFVSYGGPTPSQKAEAARDPWEDQDLPAAACPKKSSAQASAIATSAPDTPNPALAAALAPIIARIAVRFRAGGKN